jgi:hypothetical protein
LNKILNIRSKKCQKRLLKRVDKAHGILLSCKEPRRTRDRTPLRRGKLGQLSAQGTVGCRCVHEAGICYNLSNKVRLSFFRFPKEADRYSNVDVEIQDISKNMFCHRISMLFSSSDMTSSVNGASIVLSIKRCPAVPIGALGL